ncbi:MAG: hypothetical protein GX117_05755 [Candidatus Hydrogenedentes bacterium]|nr:hypothetical protein [Candidatus Hydrogenedentota bacterium]
MNLGTKAHLLYHILRWLVTRNRFDTHYTFKIPGNPKFVGAREAVALIPDHAVVATSGLGGNQWPSILYRCLRRCYEETGHPQNLSLIAIGGMGARGRAPGSIEELGIDGLCTRLFTGHTETYKSILRLADSGKAEIQCLPQGILAFLIEGQGQGKDSLLTDTGVGTFLDPRVGSGTPIAHTSRQQWVQLEGEQLRYRLPPITVALLNAPSADSQGNIYVRNASMIAESMEIVRAARHNGGLVIVNVASVVEEDPDAVFLPASWVDRIVVYPKTEQAASIRHRRYWPLFTLDSPISIDEGIRRLKFVNQVLGITPRRSQVDYALARLAASFFSEHVKAGSLVNIGTGLPEEVCRILYGADVSHGLHFFTESGVLGGLPAPGVFFGAAVCPDEMISSAQIFHRCYEGLDASILGMLEFDGFGNVNVSKRGDKAINAVGPGGFIDFSINARNLFFIATWMVGAQMRIHNGALFIDKAGSLKLKDQIREITFNGKLAAQRGQQVFYITNVGVFKLTEKGLMLIRVVPGVDIGRDILEPSDEVILLPPSGVPQQVDFSIMTGENYTIKLVS